MKVLTSSERVHGHAGIRYGVWISLLPQCFRLPPRPVLVVRVLLHVHGPEALCLIDERPLGVFWKKFPFGTWWRKWKLKNEIIYWERITNTQVVQHSDPYSTTGRMIVLWIFPWSLRGIQAHVVPLTCPHFIHPTFIIFFTFRSIVPLVWIN